MAIEKRQLIEELDAAGVKFETIELVKTELGIGAEPDRFAEMPKEGETIYIVNPDDGVVVGHTWHDTDFDREQWAMGNIFPNRQAADRSHARGLRAKQKAWATIERAAAKYAQPTAEDWVNQDVAKYFPKVGMDGDIVVEWTHREYRLSPLPHFLHIFELEAFAAECEAEIKLVMGVKS